MAKPLKELEADARALSRVIAGALPRDTAFFLILSDVGANGSATWLSSADREDSVRLLREMADHLERTLSAEAAAKNRELAKAERRKVGD